MLCGRSDFGFVLVVAGTVVKSPLLPKVGLAPVCAFVKGLVVPFTCCFVVPVPVGLPVLGELVALGFEEPD